MSRTHKDRRNTSHHLHYLSKKAGYKVFKKVKMQAKSRRKTLATETNGRALKLGSSDSWNFD